jgi:hypothetical protein
MGFEPDMHTRLVAHFDSAFQRLVKRGRHPADHQILGFIGNIGGVEIPEIVVPDPVIGPAAGQMVQHPLIHRPRHHQPIGQTKRPPGSQHPHQGGCGTHDLGQALGQLGVTAGRAHREPVNDRFSDMIG